MKKSNLFKGILLGGVILSASIGNAQFVTSGTAGTVTTYTNGKVGIGTSIPNAPLHIQSSGDVSYLNIATNHPTSKRTRINFSQTNATGVNTFGMEVGTDLAGVGANNLYIYNRANNKVVAFFDGEGNNNVGIGTPTPGAKLDVNGDIKSAGSVAIGTTLNVVGAVGIQSNSVLEFGVGLTKEVNAGKIGYGTFDLTSLNIVGAGTTGTNRRITFFNEGGATFNGGVNVTGNAGIGTSIPSAKLEVIGDVRATGGGLWSQKTPDAQNGYIAGTINFSAIDASQTPLNPSTWIAGMSNNLSTKKDEFFIARINTSANNLGSAWTTAFQIKYDGQVLMSPTSAQATWLATNNATAAKLVVGGKVAATEVVVSTSDWSDFVFDESYKLQSLSEVEAFIKANKHLPAVPSEKEVVENGVNTGEMLKTHMRKIEELTLYVIELKKEIEVLKK